ncbi:MAG: adenylate kinase [Sphingobacteriia bacterium]|nr:adenylate kinase [Sphingobacteriia bacterium]
MRIIFLGPPGSGKGTQADILKEKLNLVKLSTGDIFRELSKENNDLALEVKSIMNKGMLLPDHLVTKVVIDRISKDDCKSGFILDGYPRTLNQAVQLDEFLNNANIKIDAVINLNVNEEVLVNRIVARITCKSCNASYNKFTNPTKVENVCDKCGSNEFVTRGDDNEDSIRTRMKEYFAQTYPLVAYYKKKEILKDFDGSKNLENITKEILNALN